jgi:hypothetical protein
MKTSKFEITLFVSDQQKSRDFYSAVVGKPELEFPE